MLLRRAVKVSLKWVGVRDRRRLAALLQAYRAAVNFFIRVLWREPDAKFSTATSERLAQTRLSTRYRDQALKQAVETVAATKKSAKELAVDASQPFFKGSAILDAKFVKIERVEGELDLVVHLACLDKGGRLRLSTKRTRVLKKWLQRPGARLVQGCGLGDGDELTLWLELPAPPKRTEGPVLGVDVGVSKLLATSEGEFLGTDFRAARDKVRRRRPGSKGRRRARRERDDLVNYCAKRLPWARVRAVAFEDLTGIKRGKKPGRGRSFRRAMAPWRPPLVEQRLSCLAVENGAYAIPVPAAWNSTTCPLCRHRSRQNRRGDLFRCMSCGLVDDADHVGALAIETLGRARLAQCVATSAKEHTDAEAKRERRLAAAKKRGQATAEKWRKKREAAIGSNRKEDDTAKSTQTQDSSSRAAQSPAARTRTPNPRSIRSAASSTSKSVPVRDPACGGVPQNVGGPPPAKENPEGGQSRESCLKAAGRRGEEPLASRPPGPRGELPSSGRSRVLAPDEYSDKP